MSTGRETDCEHSRRAESRRAMGLRGLVICNHLSSESSPKRDPNPPLLPGVAGRAGRWQESAILAPYTHPQNHVSAFRVASCTEQVWGGFCAVSTVSVGVSQL